MAIIELVMFEERRDSKNMITTVKHGGGSITTLCFSANSTGALHIIEGNTNGQNLISQEIESGEKMDD